MLEEIKNNLISNFHVCHELDQIINLDDEIKLFIFGIIDTKIFSFWAPFFKENQ